MTNPDIKVKRSRKSKTSSTEKQMMVASTSDDCYDIFDKQTIVNSLMKECDLAEQDCITVANRVEEIILKSNLKNVSSSYIRSLVNQLLSEYGYDKWLKYSSLSIPLYDIKQFVEEHNTENSNTAFSPESINMTIAGQILKQYALREIFEKEVSEGHIFGDYHIHDLDYPNRSYCSGNNIAYIIKNGLKLNGIITQSSPAKHALTLVNHLSCFTNYLQCFFSGAIGYDAVNMFFAPFLVGKSYKEIKQIAQHLIYSFAQLAGARGGQTAFTDFNMFLRIPEHYKKANAIGPNGELTGKRYEDYEYEARTFLKAIFDVLDDGDCNGTNFAFPKILLHINENDFNDELLDIACSINSKRGSVYILYDRGKTVKVAQCPLGGEETVLVYSKQNDRPIIRAIGTMDDGEIYKIYADGKFVEGRFNKYPNQYLYKMILNNNHEMVVSENHLNLCMLGFNDEIQNLTTLQIKDKLLSGEDVWLPYSLKALEGNGGNYEFGFIVGAFAGDGSGTFDLEKNIVTFSLSEGKKENTLNKIKDICERYFGAKCSVVKDADTKLLTLFVNSLSVLGLCREFVLGMNLSKEYAPRVFAMSKEFRQGIMDGHYATDGSSSGRIYTSSIRMVKSLNMLAFSLGTTTSINVDERTQSIGKLSNNPVYCVLIYKASMEKYKDIYFKKYDKIWIKLNHLLDVGTGDGFCFEVLNDEPLFTVSSSGILTHNCRLSVEMSDKDLETMMNAPEEMRFSALQNCTINLPRIAYKFKNISQIHKEIDRILHLVMKAHCNKRDYILKLLNMGDKGCLNFLAKGMDGKPYLRPNELKYLVGIIGLNEMVQCLTGKELYETEDALKFGLEIISYIYISMKKISEKYGLNCLLEETPAEGLSLRAALLDVKQYPEAIQYIKGDIKSNQIYYTNSVHLPYYAPVDILTRIEKQSKFAPIIQAGSIIHNWFGEHEPDPKSLKKLYEIVLKQTKAVQTADSPEMTSCNACHKMTKGLLEICPSCQSTDVFQLTRITGYFSKISGWTKSKIAELKDRKRVNFEMKQFISEDIPEEKILFFSKPNCEKCDYVKKQLFDKPEIVDKLEIIDISDYKGLAKACYYNIELLPTIAKVEGSRVISKLEQTGSFIKWIKENIKEK